MNRSKLVGLRPKGCGTFSGLKWLYGHHAAFGMVLWPCLLLSGCEGFIVYRDADTAVTTSGYSVFVDNVGQGQVAESGSPYREIRLIPTALDDEVSIAREDLESGGSRITIQKKAGEGKRIGLFSHGIATLGGWLLRGGVAP